jgi:serine/threonine protein kinase/tetratricopeptide (TPR) repeat protein
MNTLKTGDVIAHYELRGLLGGGRLGRVYRAHDTRADRDVAIKVLSDEFSGDPEALETLRREARAIGQINHPSVATLFGVEELHGEWCLILEYVDGPTLAERIAAGRLSVGESVTIARQIAEGMAVAHAHGIVHRDLKPANVVLNADGRPKVLDFGLARVTPHPVGEGKTTRESQPGPGGVSGTLDYLAPEAFLGGGQGRAGDIYALGSVLFEMLTGTTPFGNVPVGRRVAAILEEVPPRVTTLRRDVPPSVEQFIIACLGKDVRERPPSMQLVVDELQQIEAECCASHRPSTLAVHEFIDMSPGQDQRYFCEGMTEDLIHTLNQVPEIRVVGRSHEGKSAVSAVLEGSVRRFGDRLRVLARLVDPASGVTIWSDRYDREVVDAIEVQGELADSIAQALQAAFVPGPRERAGVPDFSAYDTYLRGRSLLYQYRRRSVEQALALFEKAVARDPDYALAHAGISNCHCFLFLYVEGRAGSLEKAEAASARAVASNPQLAEAHAARGQALSLAGHHAEAEECFRNALSLAPSQFDAYYWYARDSFAQGKLELAAVQFEQAHLVAPDDYQSPLLVAQIYDTLGRDEDARRSRETGVRVAEQRLRVAPGDVRARYMGANGLVALGRIDEGLEWASMARFMEPEEPMVLYNVACVHALAGQAESSMDLLEEAVHRGLMQKDWILHDSNLDSLRDLPRFARLLEWLDGHGAGGG